MYRTSRFIVSISVALIFLLALAGAIAVRADSVTTSFDSLAVGNINGQDGWSMTGAYDVEVVTNTYGYASFGTQSLRLSNAVTSGSFGDQTFAKPLVNAVGEISATAGSFTVGTRQTHFEMQFDIASTQSTQQSGMMLSVSPDRGDGSRMSYLRFEDAPNGINVFFDDVQQPTPCTPAGCANFVETQIVTETSRSVPHTIKLTMDTLDGPSNDVVKVYIDGTLVHTGTSWEDYYRYDPEAAGEQSPRIVKTVLFRLGGTAVPANLGKGFLVDNFSTSSSSFTLSAGTTGNGSGTIELNPPGGRYDSVTVVTMTATANTGSSFAGWSGDLSGSVNPITVTMDSNKSVTATFNLNTYTLSTGTTGNGNGSIGLNPPGGTYTYGTVVTVTATANTGSSFAGWSGDLSGSVNPITVTIDGNKSITATFNLNTYTLNTATAGTGSGTIGLNPPGGTYNYGTVVTVTATPSISSTFTGWSGDLSGSVNPITTTIDGNKFITATFTAHYLIYVPVVAKN